jgi:hypothetical protein
MLLAVAAPPSLQQWTSLRIRTIRALRWPRAYQRLDGETLDSRRLRLDTLLAAIVFPLTNQMWTSSRFRMIPEQR